MEAELYHNEWLRTERLCHVMETNVDTNERIFDGYASDTKGSDGFCDVCIDQCQGNPCADSQLCIESLRYSTVPWGEVRVRPLSVSPSIAAHAAAAHAAAAVAAAARVAATVAAAHAAAAVSPSTSPAAHAAAAVSPSIAAAAVLAAAAVAAAVRPGIEGLQRNTVVTSLVCA